MRVVREIAALLGAKIPFEKAADWDVCGLQLGDPGIGVESIGVCHEVTESVMEKLKDRPVDLLVSYHPLLFHPVRRLLAGPGPEGKVLRLVESRVNLLIVHTAFDAAPGGTSDSLAEAVGLKHVEAFGSAEPAEGVRIVVFVPPGHVDRVAEAMSLAGAGQIGNYRGCSFWGEGTGSFEALTGANPTTAKVGVPESVIEARLEMLAPAKNRDRVLAAMLAAHPYEEPVFDVYHTVSNVGFVGRVGELPEVLGETEFVEQVLNALGRPVGARVARTGRSVSRVAVIPGSGSSFVVPAIEAGADYLITGDVGHHKAVEAVGLGMGVVDAGHTATERPGMETLVEWISEIGVQTIDFTNSDPSPWS